MSLKNIDKFYLPERDKKFPEGFTLVETIIVIAIVIIISAIAVPSFKHLIISDRLQSVAWQMVQDLREIREDAILYQQDLNVYFDYDSSATPKPHSATDFINREYLFETFQYDSLTASHYIPTDSLDTHFSERVLKYGIVISNISSTTTSSIDFSGKHYFVLTFRCGDKGAFRGEANIVTSMTGRNNDPPSAIGSTPIVITLEDVPSGQKFYVIIKGTGGVSMNGSPPS